MLLPTTAKGACADFFSQEAFGDKIFVYIERYPSEAKVDRLLLNFQMKLKQDVMVLQTCD